MHDMLRFKYVERGPLKEIINEVIEFEQSVDDTIKTLID